MNEDTETIDAEQEQADFGAGFSGVEVKTDKPAKPEPAETPRVEAPPEKFVQISEKDWAEVRAAAAKTASYDQQLSKAFGTIGNMQKMLNEQRAKEAPQPAPTAARKVEIPKDTFAAMERDFPELAQQTRAALEAALSGIPVNGANDAQDPAKLENLLQQYTAKREVEALEDAYPDWRTIVGAVDAAKETPDPDNAFRKWLAGKDEAYQTKVNGSESAAVIGRAIKTFQRETAAPKPTVPQRDTARADRLRAAVQPRGDNAGAPPSKTADDEFHAGFIGR